MSWFNQGTGFTVLDETGLTSALTVDGANGTLGVFNNAPGYTLDVGGTVHADAVVAGQYQGITYAQVADAPTKLSDFTNDLPPGDGQVQSDWAQADEGEPDFIRNKPRVLEVSEAGSVAVPGNLTVDNGVVVVNSNSPHLVSTFYVLPPTADPTKNFPGGVMLSASSFNNMDLGFKTPMSIGDNSILTRNLYIGGEVWSMSNVMDTFIDRDNIGLGQQVAFRWHSNALLVNDKGFVPWDALADVPDFLTQESFGNQTGAMYGTAAASAVGALLLFGSLAFLGLRSYARKRAAVSGAEVVASLRTYANPLARQSTSGVTAASATAQVTRSASTTGRTSGVATSGLRRAPDGGPSYQRVATKEVDLARISNESFVKYQGFVPPGGKGRV